MLWIFYLHKSPMVFVRKPLRLMKRRSSSLEHLPALKLKEFVWCISCVNFRICWTFEQWTSVHAHSHTKRPIYQTIHFCIRQIQSEKEQQRTGFSSEKFKPLKDLNKCIPVELVEPPSHESTTTRKSSNLARQQAHRYAKYIYFRN